jgi:hypothetical protein
MSLLLRIGSLSLASVVLMAAPLLAQDPSKDKAGDKTTQDTKPAATRPASAAVQQKLSIPVTGLTAENAEKVQTTLSGLSYNVWICPECKMTGEAKGQCPMCKKDMTSQAQKSLGNVKADATAGTVTANLNAGTQIKLSELERALGSSSVKLNPAKLTLGGQTHFIVQGPGAAADAKKFEEALKTSKLFEAMEIKHDADSRDYVVIARVGSAAPTHASVSQAIEKSGEGFKLVDVVWVAPKQMS